MPEDTVTQCVKDLRASDQQVQEDAAQRIVSRFSALLLAAAYRHVTQNLRRHVDFEALVQSVYKSFFVRLEAGQFTALNSGDAVWALLLKMTVRKVKNAV